MAPVSVPVGVIRSSFRPGQRFVRGVPVTLASQPSGLTSSQHPGGPRKFLRAANLSGPALSKLAAASPAHLAGGDEPARRGTSQPGGGRASPAGDEPAPPV